VLENNMRFLITNRAPVNGGWTNQHNPTGITFWTNSGGSWTALSSVAFLAAVRAPGKPVVIFVHGFNNGIDKALATSSEIERGLPGATVILFSWISDGEVELYLQDRIHAVESVPDVLQALTMFRGASVVSHSMGNLIIDQALKAYAKIAQGPLIDSLAMVAADIEDTALGDPVYKNFVARGEVFYCMDDGALLASTELHAFPRLGLTGPMNGMPPNFTRLNCTEKLGLFDPDKIGKHGKYFVEPWFYQDIHQLMASLKTH
jgi:esterase/lipase superfamily enzyme